MESWTPTVNSCFIHKMLEIANVREKLAAAPGVVEKALAGEYLNLIPLLPARDIRTVPISELRGKPGLSTLEGQARLLHDIGNIELQAMELAFRTLVEFPSAPRQFREEIAQLTLSEAKHCKLCLDGLDELGFPWGTWPGHLALWASVSGEDFLLDRILIVHRYLEGSGLDAGHGILRKLSGINNRKLKPILDVIVSEEMDHVQFGSRWFNKICEALKLDPNQELRERLISVKNRIPKRLEKMNFEIRKRAGFNDYELLCLKELQEGLL